MDSVSGTTNPSRPDRVRDFQIQPLRPMLWPGEFQPFTRTEITAALDIETSIEPSLVCLKCKPIRVWLAEHLPSHRTFDEANPLANHNVHTTFKHYYAMEQLEKSCARGRHLYTLIRQSIFDGNNFDQMRATVRDRQTYLAKFRKATQINVVLLALNAFMDGCADAVCHLSTRIQTQANETIVGEKLDISRWPDFSKDSHAASCMTSTASTAMWQLALKWIHECTTSHEIWRAKSALLNFLPTRLVDVGLVEGLNPRLTITATDLVSGPYVALSYR